LARQRGADLGACLQASVGLGGNPGLQIHVGIAAGNGGIVAGHLRLIGGIRRLRLHAVIGADGVEASPGNAGDQADRQKRGTHYWLPSGRM